MPLLPYLNLANIIMVFLLTVVLVAARLGRGPAVAATIIAVLAFDFFYVPPRFSFDVIDLQYLVTFMIMLAVGLITSHFTANLRYQARVAADRESRSRALYEFARELSGHCRPSKYSALRALSFSTRFMPRRHYYCQTMRATYNYRR
jgi:two-component system sensor histidine kinase KdpD